MVAGARRRAVRDGDRQTDTAHLLHALLEHDPQARAAVGEPRRLARLLGYLVQRSIGYGLRWQTGVEDSGALPVVAAPADRPGQPSAATTGRDAAATGKDTDAIGKDAAVTGRVPPSRAGTPTAGRPPLPPRSPTPVPVPGAGTPAASPVPICSRLSPPTRGPGPWRCSNAPASRRAT
ncbi:peptidase [Streptomyces nogalater]